jgi:hypothetical protein
MQVTFLNREGLREAIEDYASGLDGDFFIYRDIIEGVVAYCTAAFATGDYVSLNVAPDEHGYPDVTLLGY